MGCGVVRTLSCWIAAVWHWASLLFIPQISPLLLPLRAGHPPIFAQLRCSRGWEGCGPSSGFDGALRAGHAASDPGALGVDDRASRGGCGTVECQATPADTDAASRVAVSRLRPRLRARRESRWRHPADGNPQAASSCGARRGCRLRQTGWTWRLPSRSRYGPDDGWVMSHQACRERTRKAR